MEGGQHAKLTIIPYYYSKGAQGSTAGAPFVAQFNPESFSVNTEIDLGPEKPTPGSTGNEAKFNAIKPRTFSFEFLLDGTGASGEKKDVAEQIKLFRKTVGFTGKTHRSRFLELVWGKVYAVAALASFSVTYKLFKPDGTPLRAVLSASFKEHKEKELNALEDDRGSPDVVHAHLVEGGQHLSWITHQIYRDPRYYIHVAETNELNNLRSVEPGKTVYLYPLS